jgi:hypothetical protein
VEYFIEFWAATPLTSKYDKPCSSIYPEDIHTEISLVDRYADLGWKRLVTWPVRLETVRCSLVAETLRRLADRLPTVVR